MAAIVNLVGTCISAVFNFAGVVVVVGAAGAGLAVCTVPDNKELESQVNNDLTMMAQSKSRNSTNVLETIAGKALPTLATKTATFSYQNFVIFKIACVVLFDKTRLTYVGAFNNWFKR